MLNKEVLINIFQKLLEQAKNSHDEFNAADGKIGDGDLGITIQSGLEEIKLKRFLFNHQIKKKFTDSEPTRPVEPVIITTDILDKYINLFLSKELFYQLFF